MTTSNNCPPCPPCPNVNEHKFLVAVSEQREHLLGLRFLSSFLQSRKGVNLELFFLLPPQKTVKHGPYGTIMGKATMDETTFEIHVKRGHEAVAEARKQLVKEGFPEENVKAKFASPEEAKHWNMLHEVQHGHFEAIVLGNRGRGWLERVLEGDIDLGEELLHYSCMVPLWVCSAPRKDAAHVLLCLDGSDTAYHMATHTGKILYHEPQHNVTMLRVQRENPASDKTPQEIFAKGRELLMAQGLQPERISEKIVHDNDIARAIMQEADANNFAVVAAGRHGIGRGSLENIFLGSVTENLFRKMNQGALWVMC